jgi:hypothetical protein
MQVGAPNRANPNESVIYRSILNPPKIQRNVEVLLSDERAVLARILCHLGLVAAGSAHHACEGPTATSEMGHRTLFR